MMNREKIQQITKDLVYDGWTWNTLSVLTEEEHKQLDKYIENYEAVKAREDAARE